MGRNRALQFCAAMFMATLALPVANSFAASVTGNAATDGWTAGGNSLESGVYVGGAANYAYDTYGTSMTVAAGSNLDIPGLGAESWLAGDTVLGLGGVFDNVSAADAGWAAFSGVGVNADLAHASGPKLQAKFGTSSSAFTPSSTAPGAGNGNGSLSFGGTGAVQVRTTAYNAPSSWLAGSGALNPESSSHVVGFGTSPDYNAVRIIWNWTGDATPGHLVSWEILLNTSLLSRVTGGPVPTAGALSLMTVQDGDNDFTDAVVSMPNLAPGQAVPLPASAWMGLSLLGLMGLATKFRGKLA